MKQSKKIFTRMLINNWGGISHKVLEFHEYVNLFSGKSGSGKSTVMDAIQVILYGSTNSNFLNKAADDAKNRRSVLSYLRGAQKDGSYNRDGQDFCAQIVLEILDTGTKAYTCFGMAFEVGKNDADIRNYKMFSHSGRLPEDEYLVDRVPYSIAQLRTLIEKRKLSGDNRGRGDVNRIYPSREAYLNTLYDVILGYIESGRLMTMEKSAIALRMTNGTSQFIRDYMFPKSKEDTITAISDQLGAYREIKEKVEDLEHRITLLQDIQSSHVRLQTTQADILKNDAIVKYLDIRNTKDHLEGREQELQNIEEQRSRLQAEKEQLSAEQEADQNARIEVEANLKGGDYGQKKQELESCRRVGELLAGNSRQWRMLLAGLKKWDEDEIVTSYVSNRALQLITKFQEGEVTESGCEELQSRLKEAREQVEEALQEEETRRRETAAELKEKQEIAEDLKNDRKPYSAELKQVRSLLEQELKAKYGRKAAVYVFADLFDITGEEWKDAIEGRMGRLKYSLVTEPTYALEAARLFRRIKKEEIDLINTAAIERDQPQAEEGTLYEEVKAAQPFADLCLKRYLGRIKKCHTVEELNEVRDGVTPDCYSYSNYLFRHLREKDYTVRACIGTKVSKARLQELEEEITVLQEDLRERIATISSLRAAQSFEQLNQEPEQILQLAGAAKELERNYVQQTELEKELRKLEDGTLVAGWKKLQKELSERMTERQDVLRITDKKILEQTEAKGKAEGAISSLKNSLEEQEKKYTPSAELEAQAEEEIAQSSWSRSKNSRVQLQERLNAQLEAAEAERAQARSAFNREYPAFGFTGLEKENDVYTKELEHCLNDFEPQYKADFQKQCDQVYHSLRDNVIATIHGDIRAANRQARDINRLLSKIKFSDSIYQIEILPAQNANGQFYDMLMAEELDSKVIDNAGIDGQISLGDDLFYQKYEQKIAQLTEKFMPPREEDAAQLKQRRQEMEQYADYRNYLTFSMYEKVTDENGVTRKNPVDDMAGRDSGGEGQNPKYVALLAGFAMLYMQQSNRDSKMKLVLLDEAFSKMDKERSEVCLHYARELDLQLIVCVPDERLQSLIRNVDSVYGFRRFQNQITMMHIDKGQYLSMVEGEDA